MNAFEHLNKLKWKGGLSDSEIIILHRGAPEDRKTISGKAITEIKRGYFMYKEDDKEVFIPLHRILEIRKNREILYKKKQSVDLENFHKTAEN